MVKKRESYTQQEHLMSIKEVAEYLKLNMHTVYKLVQHGEIPGLKLGGSWRFRKDEIYRWLAEKMTRDKKERLIKWQQKYDKLIKKKP